MRTRNNWVITWMIMGTLTSTGVKWREQCWWYLDSMSRSWCRAVITQVVTCSSSKSLQAPCLPDYGRSSNFTKLISSSNILSHSGTYSSLLVFSTRLLVLMPLCFCPLHLKYPTWILLPPNKIGHQDYWPFRWLNDADIARWPKQRTWGFQSESKETQSWWKWPLPWQFFGKIKTV